MKNLFVDDYGLTALGFTCAMACIIFTLFVLPAVTLCWYQAKVEAQIYNQINGTTWTTNDFFWAGGQINSQTQTVRIK
jgi:hypothetical protein